MTTTRVAARVFVLGEDASEQRLRAEHAPEIAGDLAGRQLFGLTVAGERRVAGLAGGDVREHRVVAPPLVPFGGVEKNFESPSGPCRRPRP